MRPLFSLMAIVVLGLLLLAWPAAAPRAATKAMCEAEGWVVKESRRGAKWWRCCVGVPPGVLRKEARQLCFHCKGESETGTCDQLPVPDATLPEQGAPAPASAPTPPEPPPSATD